MNEPGDRDTDVPFSPEEVEAIRRMLSTPGSQAECPRCHTPLSSGTPVAGGASMYAVYRVRCPTCRRVFFATDNRSSS